MFKIKRREIILIKTNKLLISLLIIISLLCFMSFYVFATDENLSQIVAGEETTEEKKDEKSSETPTEVKENEKSDN